jgi:hypothetical protein
MQTHNVLDHIFAKMTGISKWQRDFLRLLFATIFALQGRVTFTNLARYGTACEQTFRRNFAKDFDWLWFNSALIECVVEPQQICIGVFDCSFIEKSGKKTYGLDRFWSSSDKAAKCGLEIAHLGCICVETEQAWTLDVTQTPPGLSTDKQTAEGASCYTRVDFYMEQVTDCLGQLQHIQHFVADGYYARRKVFDTLTRHGKHLIVRLRSDANLRYLSEGSRKPGQKGPTPRYAGKVRWGDLSRFAYVGVLEDKPHIVLYTKVLNSPYFKRDFRVVVLVNTKTDKYVLLASTDIMQSAEQIVAYYRLRFQVEFLFRDAKQFAGLCHCQARSEAKLDFHFNMSLAAVNLARLEMVALGVSFNSYVRRAYNRFLVASLLEQLGLEAEFGLTDPVIEAVVNTGRMAA